MHPRQRTFMKNSASHFKALITQFVTHCISVKSEEGVIGNPSFISTHSGTKQKGHKAAKIHLQVQFT